MTFIGSSLKRITKVKNFLSLNREKKLLLIEAYVFLGIARIAKARPFSKVAPSLGANMEETPLNSRVNTEILQHISEAIHIMSSYTFWESQCLVKAIAGMRMLERRGIESTLYLGTSRDDAGKMIAHAWLRSGSFYISGSEGMERFSVVGKFAKEVKLNKVLGESNG
ncbi:MAG TPA: lasso peptide biosynthesis B2 protein [Bacillus bacterium]|nr:lasso peptide biosynthesis B2 protein [Bacillus sp. (in: firmicutes)]